MDPSFAQGWSDAERGLQYDPPYYLGNPGMVANYQRGFNAYFEAKMKFND